MQSGVRAGTSFIAFLALLVASAPAAAAPKPITGKLSKPGYTVIALTASGRAASVRASKGKFKLRPPARRVTLQLRSPDGTYAGPIVVGGGGDRVIVGVQAGARLGGIAVDVRKGFARVKRRLPKRWRDPSAAARARNGVPIGAGNYGRVRSRISRASAAAGARSSRDRDLDGVPGALDIDDDGDLLLDNFERSSDARASQADESLGAPIYLSSGLEQVRINQTVNANAAALTVADIDETLKTLGRLQLAVLPGDTSPNSPELDCGGLVYCSRGGTGKRGFNGSPPPPPFPECCDPDGDGFGTMTPWDGGASSGFFLAPHGATTEQVRTGDVLIERVTRGGVETQFTSTLQFVFATVPALVSYGDTAGNCAQVSGTAGNCATVFSYPVAEPAPGCPLCGLGTEGNGFPVAPGPNGEIEVTLTFWRPQRGPIPPETAQWIDIGGLTYAFAFGCDASGCGNRYCPPAAYSTAADSGLSPTTLQNSGGGLKDSAPDRPAGPQYTFTYKVNLSECLRDSRMGFGNDKPLTWEPGQTRQLVLQGTTLRDRSEQIIYFKRQ